MQNRVLYITKCRLILKECPCMSGTTIWQQNCLVRSAPLSQWTPSPATRRDFSAFRVVARTMRPEFIPESRVLVPEPTNPKPRSRPQDLLSSTKLRSRCGGCWFVCHLIRHRFHHRQPHPQMELLMMMKGTLLRRPGKLSVGFEANSGKSTKGRDLRPVHLAPGGWGRWDLWCSAPTPR